MKLNNKGIFFTVTITFFLLSVIYFSSSIDSNLNSFSVFYSSISRSSSINSKFNSIYSNIVLLESEGKLKELKERVIPFTYSLNSNFFSLNSSIPLNSLTQEIYFDYINSFEVLISDENRFNAFDGIKTEFNANKNNSWGGEANSMNFLLYSHCAKNSFNNLSSYSFSFTECNSSEFNFNNLNAINLTLNVNPQLNEDFNSVYCNFNGIETCFQEEFNPLNPFPFLNLSFNAINCFNCDLKEKTISTHFNPTQNNFIIFSCEGISCESEQIRIDLFNELKISREGLNQIDFNIEYDFNSTVYQLEINDVYFKVIDEQSLISQEFLR